LVMTGPDHLGEGAAAHLRAREMGLGEAVRFTGPVAGAERLAALRAADVFTLPAYSEGLPNAVLEAADTGLARVASDECHVPEVTAYEAGRVIAPQRDALVHALDALLADAALRTRCGEQARAMAREQFSMPVMIDRIEAMYRQVAGQKED